MPVMDGQWRSLRIVSVRSNRVLINLCLEVQKKLNSLKTKDYNFFLGKMYFKSDDGSQNMFVYQPTLNTLKKTVKERQRH